MKKIAVITLGWHFSSHFYENMPKQLVPKGWEVDYFCIAHRLPEDENTINEKEDIRNMEAENFLFQIDQKLYEYSITQKDIENFGWKFTLEENTIGDMESFNQWSNKYDYTEYDIICLSHDDKYILSNKVFVDIIENNIDIYMPIKESRYGVSNHQFEVKKVPINETEWLFLENGYSQHIPKAFSPRTSFSFYKKEFMDMLPNNKFDMTDNGKEIMNRVGKTDSPKDHQGLSEWNTMVGTLRDWLYVAKPDLGMLNHYGWLSESALRVSKYCIEGERGFIHKHNADCGKYIPALLEQLENMNMIESEEDKKYSVYTILNSVYMKYFGKIFINSLYDKVDVDKIETIYIGDTGLNDYDIEYLSKFDKVKIVSTDISDKDGGFAMWDDKWHNSVSQKTKLLRELVKTESLPIVMLDADLLFLKDISSLIDDDYDIQVCFRNHERRETPHQMDYLASYVSVNNKSGLKFLDKWIDMIDNSDSINYRGNLIQAKETPCLCKTVEIFNEDADSDLKIGDVAEDIVSVYDPPGLPTMPEPDVCRIIHFKGAGANGFKNTIEEAYDGKVIKKGWGGYIEEKGYLN